MSSNWSIGLCNCGDTSETCCLIWCCPCVAFGRTAEVIDDGRSSSTANCCIYLALGCVGFQWLYTCTYRKKMRDKFGLKEPCSDCCVHCFCPLCALCQEYAELKNRGFDPSKGYVVAPTAPPTVPVMHN